MRKVNPTTLNQWILGVGAADMSIDAHPSEPPGITPGGWLFTVGQAVGDSFVFIRIGMYLYVAICRSNPTYTD